MNDVVVNNLSVALDGRTVLHDVSFQASSGQIMGVIGPNGAGKTTLVRSILRLTPFISGEIFLGGQDVSNMAAHEINKDVAYLPQGQTVHWPMTAERLVALGRAPMSTPFSRPSDEDRAAVDRAISAAGLEQIRDRPITHLSGGERARVLLARVLAGDPKIIMADEPVASLDPYHQLSVMDLLRQSAEHGRAIMVVLHDLSLAARYCDRLILLSEGAVVANGAPADVLTVERMAEIYRVKATIGADGEISLAGRVE
jgi:iron complex transport system ATP-binding protein